jgi:hypothetical protein
LFGCPFDPEPLRSLSPFFRPEAQLFFETARDLSPQRFQMKILAPIN